MKLTKRQLNKKLKSKILRPSSRRPNYMRDTEITVLRARTKKVWRGEKTWVTIKIKATVQSSRGKWYPLLHYGPRHIRNFLRRDSSLVTSTVSEWVRLWGFGTDVYLEKIELISS